MAYYVAIMEEIIADKKRKWREDDPRYKNRGRLCDMPDCGKPFYAKGLCHKHFNRLSRKGFLASRVFIPTVCSLNGCQKIADGALGFCKFHYDRYKRGVDFNRPKGIKGELNHNWNGGVSQYPNHYQMKKIRNLILEKSKFTCYYCGKPANQIHHKDLSKNNHSEENLVASCRSCNLKRHKNGTSKLKRKYGKRLAQIGDILGCSYGHVYYLHKIGKLDQMIQPDEIQAILF